MSKTAYVLRHVMFEHLGILAPLLDEADWRVEMIEAPLADLTTLAPSREDMLIVLGGPIGAYEEAIYPFITAELALIKRALATGVRFLGICLGAQLLARACGAKVYPGRSGKEIGFKSLVLTAGGMASPLRALEGAAVLHWHGDTFDLPAGAQCLASSDLYENQAFSLGPQVLGLQFHIETDPAQIETWLVGHAAELAGAEIDPRELRVAALEHRADLVVAGQQALREWLAS